ncbi:MAG TPA: ABC transporter permease [Pyrinomonadaceae bacterium]|nr:ABC transporter permease [Pyrinomonadaceae bacterium]
MRTLLQDSRYGLRMLLKNPGFTFVAALTLALGIGANTAIFSVVNAVLLRPLPFQHSDELVVIKDENGKTGEAFPSVSPADFFDWKSQNQSFAGMAAYSGWPLTLLDADRPEVVPATRVTDEFFKTLQVRPLLGNTFGPDEFKGGGDSTGGGNTVILSYDLWQRRFGGDPNVVGKKLAVEQGSLTVVGVMPPEFKLPATAEAWTPITQGSGEMHLRASRYFQTVARLKPNVTEAQAEAEMRTIAARLASQYPESDANWSVRLAPLRETLVGDVRPALLILLGAVALVLLIACGNVANLMLARATTRHKELAVRSALGASRWRIVRQLVVESLLLSGIGGALGILLAQWCVGAIVWLVPKDLRFPRMEEARVDPSVLIFTLAVALLAGLILGLIPGLRASRPDLRESLKESGRSATAGRRLRRVRGALVAAEIALTLVLLAGAGLLIKSLLKLQHVELGFNQEKLLVVPVAASMSKYAQPQARAEYFERLAAQAQTAPGVESVATASCAPMMYTMYFPFSIEGRANPNEVPQAWYNAVSPNYFQVMGVGLLEGREFTDHDRTGMPNAAVINETMRRRYFADEDPLGKRLTVNYLDAPMTLEVVGVVKDIKQESLATPANPQIYVSYLQVPWFSTALVIRARGDSNAVLTSVERAVRSFDPSQASTGAKTMEQLLYDSAAQPRFYSLLLGAFAALALLLAAVGIYGVISYAVAQRTQEIGIRMALGAQGRDVLKLVIGQGMVWVIVGVAIGLGAAFALTRVMKSLLYEVGANDPATFASVTALLTIVALAACLVPAHRATKVDPIVALRYE